MRAVFATLLSILFFFNAPASAQSRVGLASGRASEADLIRLEAQARLIREALVDLEVLRHGADLRAVGTERQRQLLGEEGTALEEVYDIRRRWWDENVYTPVFHIVQNPATPCDVALYFLDVVTNMERQAQFLGVSEEATLGENGPIGALYPLVERRCLEEAYDECVLTGSGETLAYMLRTLQHVQLGRGGEFGARVVYLYQRCTVYKLEYRIEGSLRGMMNSDYNGGVVLMFQPSTSVDDAIAQINGGEWRDIENAPESEIALTHVAACPEGGNVSCHTGSTLVQSPAHAWGRIAFARQVRDIYARENDITQLYFGSERKEGQERVSLRFLPPNVIVGVDWLDDRGRLAAQAPMGVSIFAMALADPAPEAQIALTQWKLETYPVMASLDPPKTAERSSMQARGEFRLIHRPDLFPAERINFNLELTGPRRIEPTTPARSQTQ